MLQQLQQELQSALGEEYAIERELPRGGMSRVFLANENALGRKVVIKVLAPELAATLSAERFKREIMLAARLQHPHIVPLLHAGQAGGSLYYTMPFVDGESLRERMPNAGYGCEMPERSGILPAFRIRIRHSASDSPLAPDLAPRP